ncbi:uncharacterized protein K444DRAFT_613550 [Hyaloscypha bicolor E]|uniref:Uncharacterized protein n=1 Tax=Hyaloscypha bicolor E TaxID=1095630 RepID=A0A2J6T6L6_9HELO|nr:uncharacterized protein K444DRAFT_613550 [Hyaloscypha bicolor E]PMD58671.1 hypothetical protein K444DRAFT_613550 [Hyaloscypha bicolor E]
MAGSSDSISTAFGIVSVCISLIGVWISYLTLRAMCLDDTGRNTCQRPVDHDYILRHEHTHFAGQSPSSRKRISTLA